jgi:predicted metal-dependent phosphoesterase TrpH
LEVELLRKTELHEKNDQALHIDFHVHSKYSYDSLLLPQDLIKLARKKGLDCIAITDHDSIVGGLKTSKLNDTELKIITGIEIRSEIGDVIGLFVNEQIKSSKFLEVVNDIREQGGVVVLPHPFKNRTYLSNKIIQNVDIIEVKNGRIKPELNNMAAQIAERNELPAVGGSDAHLAREVGTIQTIYSNGALYDLEDVTSFKRLIKSENPKIIGTESPRNVHYFSAVIGNLKKKQPIELGKSLIRKMKSKAY